jgi:hypothetical protein
MVLQLELYRRYIRQNNKPDIRHAARASGGRCFDFDFSNMYAVHVLLGITERLDRIRKL